ncbi:hypothetical protein J2Z50_003207 [Ensifer mexicanus]|nr:hypothetical protein [Sinorhizobium mexicanum]
MDISARCLFFARLVLRKLVQGRLRARRPGTDPSPRKRNASVVQARSYVVVCPTMSDKHRVGINVARYFQTTSPLARYMQGYLQPHHRLGRRALSQTDWQRHECSSFSHEVGVKSPLRNTAAALRKERAAKDAAGRRLLIMGSHKQAARRGAPKGPLLQQMLVRKLRMLVAAVAGLVGQSWLWHNCRQNLIGRTKALHRASENAQADMDPVRSHTGPQPRRCTKRPDRWQHPPTCQLSKKTACVLRGIHRWRVDRNG